MKSYREYISNIVQNFQIAKNVNSEDKSSVCLSKNKPNKEYFDVIEARSLKNVVLMFSPHPDDESMQSIAFRFMKDCNAEVVNIAVTLGSDKLRQLERQRELYASCEISKFKTLILGFENINEKYREISPLLWLEKSMTIVDLILEYKPIAIIYPHSDDFNSTHIGTSLLVKDALKIVKDKWLGLSIESEYWQAMKSPNLMIEIDEEILSLQLESLACHKKEIQRNPYHLMLPSYYIDNTRRGSEIIGGQGGETPNDMIFSQLYKMYFHNEDNLMLPIDSKIVSKSESLADVIR